MPPTYHQSSTADDIPFIRRLVVQSNLPRCPPDLTLSVRHLAENLNGLGMPISAEALTPTSLNESCPACGSNIPFQDIITAQCENGHSWSECFICDRSTPIESCSGRCSVTSFILSTTSVRTCVGCTRKALLPASATLGHTSMGWIVEEMLEAGYRCSFCGNNYVSIV